MGRVNTKTHTDIKLDGWIAKRCPQPLLPYVYLARLDRPVGIWLLLAPALWAIVLAAGGVSSMNSHDWNVAFLFIIGAVVMRSAGCIINDLWDAKIDKEVGRTKLRPLAAGTIERGHAFVFLFVLLLCGLGILLRLGFVTILLGVLSVPLIVLYPLMKRWTWWPQAFLGTVFNFGALMGWTAVTGILDLPALILYAAAFLWTMAYDTIYAHQDKDEDSLVGIKSTALKFGNNGKKYVTWFYGASWALTALAASMALGKIYVVFLLLPALAHIIWQMKNWRPKSAPSSLVTFSMARDYGLLVLAGVALAAF